ncbi:thymidylate synthase [mine drainage metagenome]|uniref:thymidylate synthase n=1 Tax=mine drainage metagenome TaxID=410659 RepID=T1CT66_9ZZZZ
MQNYLDLLRDVLENGALKPDRTGVGTRSVFGRELRFDLGAGFPAVTTKRLHMKSVVEELLWFLRGETNVRSLQERGVTIWDEWADPAGELGPIYGYQWRHWPTSGGQGGIDQIAVLLKGLREDPDSRRHVVSAWNVSDLPDMALAPCHIFFQLYVSAGRLSCQVYQRSADVFLGLPFNIASYALLTHLLADQAGYSVGELIWIGGDCHLYQTHLDVARIQLAREPYPPPRLRIARHAERFDQYRYEDFVLENYRHHPALRAPVAV